MAVTMAPCGAAVVASALGAMASPRSSQFNASLAGSMFGRQLHGSVLWHKVPSRSQKSSSRLRSQNKPFRIYNEKSEKLMLGAADKKEVCTIQPVENSLEKGFIHFTSSFFEVLGMVAARVVEMGHGVRDAVQKPNTEEEVQLLTALKGRMVCAAAPLLFAAISQSVNTPLTVVASGMAKWLELYSGVLMVRVLLSWFPNIPWERQPLQAMRDMCDPYLNLFRNIIPPLFNALDLSPMLAFLVLGVLTSILNTTVQST